MSHQSPPRPVVTAFGEVQPVIEGPANWINKDGRRGLLAGSLSTRFTLKGPHTLNCPRGSLTFWVLPLEDLVQSPLPDYTVTRKVEPHFELYTLLIDHPQLRNTDEASFALLWRNHWWRQLMARFVSGLNKTPSPQKPSFGPCDFHFRRGHWYQLGLSWDRPASLFRLYCNGIRVGHSNLGAPLRDERAGETLYAGNTAFALGQLNWYDEALETSDFETLFQAQATNVDTEIQHELEWMHGGRHFAPFAWEPHGAWQESLSLSLREPEHLDAFHIQGNQNAGQITPEGLKVVTPETFVTTSTASNQADTEVQVYFHSRQCFTGDIAVSLDFMPLQNKGLALLMVQASGMQGEDFLADHPHRTDGSMKMVCWENVRNYHWEFWRMMEGIRHDVATHALFKNPWFRGLGYRAMDSCYEPNQWHRLLLVQENGRLRAGINGRLIFDVVDDSLAGHGPIPRGGHVSLRNMWGSAFVWKNLQIWNHPPDWQEEPVSGQAITESPNTTIC